jgi:hypothetical protein
VAQVLEAGEVRRQRPQQLRVGQQRLITRDIVAALTLSVKCCGGGVEGPRALGSPWVANFG